MRRAARALLALLLAMGGCAPETDDDDSAPGLQATAGFTGTVVSYPEGEPIEGMSVVVFDVQARYEIFLTDEDGAYQAEGLAPGLYRAKAWPLDGQNFIGAYYDDMYFYCTGVLLDLRRGGELAGIDFRLPHGGAIAGVITDADSGEPLEGARVDVKGLDYYNSNLDPTAYTDTDGRFEVVGLDSAIESLETLTPVPGNYELKVTVPGRPVIYHPGVYSPADAEPVTALRGELGEGWDLALPAGGVIAGQVVGADGLPAEDGTISARHGELTWASVTSGLGDDGSFQLGGLAPGSWSLEARPDGLAALAPADAIEVPEDGLVEGGELVAGPAARLTGRVSGPAGAVEGVSVSLTPLDEGVDGDGVTDGEGAFAVEGLGPGEYLVHLRTGDDGLQSGYLCGATACADSAAADPVTLEEGEERDLGTVALPAAAQLAGTALELETGRPLGRIYVTATRDDATASSLAVTDDEGRYTVGGLPPESYWLFAEPYRYCGGDPGWVTTYSGGGRRPEDAVRLQLGAGAIADHDLILPRDMDGDEMGDLWEAFHRLDPARDDSLEDPDLDGVVNIDEYLEGGVPREDAPATCGVLPRSRGAGLAALITALAAATWRRRRPAERTR